MTHPLDGCRAKVDRAGEPMETLNAGVFAYFETEPYGHRIEVLEGEPPRALVTVDAIITPPPRLGVIVGEIVHNLRSALDHLVWQLALLNTPMPSDRLQFPIHTTRPDWPSVVGDRLSHVPGQAVAMIEHEQPYHHAEPEQHLLASLQVLSNEDKHHVILETVAAGSEPQPDNLKIIGARDVGNNFEIEVHWAARLLPGARVATIYFERLGPKPAFHLVSELPVDVGFGEIGLRGDTIAKLVRLTRGFIDGFGQFFEGLETGLPGQA